ncbi:hypothetical protein JOC77_003106 [Peribacillus deserti]|uniref:DnaJ homologue subfamily C member 28 conserved domain-containing protein n=1 Tax=Peribacillus deserti TaxID=673318 RepID=A0ABS2QKG0_9BACI|nr:DUF1992 domain-containing protein [Peribacillus deserti]MBM7693662.1 hypothetical protein [Peribacillus deserti]
MDFAHLVAEDKIKRSIDEGEFQRLPGYGRPLEIEDESSIPESLRMAYKLMKNAGMLDQQEEALRKELMNLEDLAAYCYDPEERESLKKQLNEKLYQFGKVIEKRKSNHSHAFKQYNQKVYDKLSRK